MSLGAVTTPQGPPTADALMKTSPCIEQGGLKLLFPAIKSDSPDVSLRGEEGQGNRPSGSWPQGLKESEPLDHSDPHCFCMLGAGQTSNNKPVSASAFRSNSVLI